jgi:transposase
MVKQLEEEYISPLKELVNDWLDLQDVIKEEKKKRKEQKKAKKHLENLQKKAEKKPEKISQEEIDIAAKELSQAFAEAKILSEKLEKKTVRFNSHKISTLKSALTSMIEAQLQFHKQAVNIITAMHGEVDKISIPDSESQ